jgi:hypothetical protein
MKKLLFLGLTALGLVLAAEQPAHAWVNCKFSVGLNWSYQSGGNTLFWGLFRNGQPPGPFQIQPPPPGVMPYPGAFPHHSPTDFQYYLNQQNPSNPGNPAVPVQAAPSLPAAAAAQQQQQAWYGQQNPYQPVNYSPNANGYPTSGQNAPGYYGYFIPPSYWYGR